MRNPLSKRLPRDLRNNLGKYLGIFLLLVLAVSMTSGFLSSAASIKVIAAEMYDRYKVEDLHFTTMYEADDETIDAVEALGCTVYENFSADVPLSVADDDRDLTVRVYENRDGSINDVAYAEGRAPKADHEIALDRVFCANHDLNVGDEVEVRGETYTLVGIMTMSDYQVTYKSASDLMFNAVTFTVAQVTPEAFDHIAGDGATFTYSVLLDERGMELVDRVSLEEDLADLLADHDVTLTDLVDSDSNIGLKFAAGDVADDMRMWEVLLFLLVAIMAFVFVVLTDATIEQESSVIGTLLASGMRKGEIVRHYMTLPVLIGLVGVVVGNALGLTALAGPMQALYYNSYSFPPFVRTWHTDVFLMTSVVPFAILVVITLVGLVRRMGASPLQLLRHEASGKQRKGGARLPEGMGYVSRFRLRVFLRNLSHFVILFFGIMFGSLLLLLGLCMLPLVDDNADLMAASVPAEHLYVLKEQLVLDGTQEERDAWAAAWELSTDPRFDAIDLDLLEDLGDQLEELGVDVDDATIDGGEFELPPYIEDAVEESINHDVDASDEALHATFVQVAAAAGIDLSDATDEQLTELISTLDTLHRQVHMLDEDAMEDVGDLLEDVMAAGDLEHPVNQTPIDPATLGQTERFAMATLTLPRNRGDVAEEITIYGIQEDSAYWDIDVSGGRVVAGRGVFEKCPIETGEDATYTDKYTNDTYEIAVDDVLDDATNMCVYMSLDEFNQLFGNDADYYNGLASDEPLELDERYVATVITPHSMQEMAEQMQDSMGAIMRMIVLMVIPVYLVLIYLLTKTVIDRSSTAISRMKVFGYHDGEISSLYIRPVTVTVLASMVLCIPLVIKLCEVLMGFMMASYSGNFAIIVPASSLAKTLVIGAVTYCVVAFIHVRRIRRIELAEAMKAQE